MGTESMKLSKHKGRRISLKNNGRSRTEIWHALAVVYCCMIRALRNLRLASKHDYCTMTKFASTEYSADPTISDSLRIEFKATNNRSTTIADARTGLSCKFDGGASRFEMGDDRSSTFSRIRISRSALVFETL